MSSAAASTRTFATFAQFYPYYLGEHSDRNCRRLHFIGTSLVIVAAVTALVSDRWGWLLTLPLFGYGFAWVGHFFFEQNQPATFKHPLYSLMGDFVMYRDIWIGRIAI